MNDDLYRYLADCPLDEWPSWAVRRTALLLRLIRKRGAVRVRGATLSEDYMNLIALLEARKVIVFKPDNRHDPASDGSVVARRKRKGS